MQKYHPNSLNLVFDKTGFTFVSFDDQSIGGKVVRFKVSNFNQWENEVIKEIEINLRLRRNYDQVNVSFVSSFFNIVPKDFRAISNENLLNFSEAEFDSNLILSDLTKYDQMVVFGTSQILIDKLTELYPKLNFYHSGQVLIDSIVFSTHQEIHLNLFDQQLEIVATHDQGILLYNMFEINTEEDILFYTLFVAEQLQYDLNKIDLKCYGLLLAEREIYQMLKKYVRHIMPASKNEEYLANYTLYNINQCESYQESSEVRE